MRDWSHDEPRLLDLVFDGLRSEHVASAPYCLDEVGRSGIALDFAAHASDVNVDGTVGDDDTLSVDEIDELIA